MIEAVAFDLDGVLIQSEEVWDELRGGYVRERGGRWDAEVQRAVMGMSSSEWSRFLHDEAGASFNLTLHPWVTGQAHRIRWLREALSRVLGRGKVWRTTTDEVARVAREQL